MRLTHSAGLCIVVGLYGVPFLIGTGMLEALQHHLGLVCQTRGLCALLGLQTGRIQNLVIAGGLLAAGVLLAAAVFVRAAWVDDRHDVAHPPLLVLQRRDQMAVATALFVSHGLLLFSVWSGVRSRYVTLQAEQTLLQLNEQVGHFENFGAEWKPGMTLHSSFGAWPKASAAGMPQSAEAVACDRMKRMGGSIDGGKMVCLDAVPMAAGACLVISVGSHGDFTFENDLHAALPHCEIHVYDGTAYVSDVYAAQAPRFLKYHATNFDASSWQLFAGAHIAVFKMDCEGCEYATLPPFLSRVCVDQILIELHEGGRRPTALLSLLNKSHGLYYAEPNQVAPPGRFAEFALRRRHDSRCKRLLKGNGAPQPHGRTGAHHDQAAARHGKPRSTSKAANATSPRPLLF